MNSLETQIKAAISAVQDSYLGKDYVSARVLRDISIEGTKAQIRLVLGYPSSGLFQSIRERITDAAQSIEGVDEVDVLIETEILPRKTQQSLKTLPGVKNTIAVASGKGGVGKSTTAVNLALAMAAEGAKVGILDADIYGPSLPKMLGAADKKPALMDNKFVPVEALGLASMSIGYLVDQDSPMIWRGPMATGALQQLLNDTLWPELDYLFIDMPPGTGDIHLTLAQKVPLTGAVIVTTPQDLALLDARKGLEMFKKVSVPVLGVIENMSLHHCSHCGHEEPIFGEGGGEKLAKSVGTECLGSLPLSMSIREDVDAGLPTLAREPDASIANHYRDIARKLGAKLSLQAQDFSSKFPKVVVENN